MKQNVLALSITAALIGLTGSAHAMTGTLAGATAGTELLLNGDGVGHHLFVPYYSAQDKNATLINLINTDQVNGKAVKVRFRGAANSDDVYDFQVFLSPGDVWTANISTGASGNAQLTTTDASCTKPAKAVLNSTPFLTTRLDTTMSPAQKSNGTREGYIEIFNMGDIPKTAAGAGPQILDLPGATTAGVGAGDNPLFTAIKHVSKVAPCSGNAWTALDTTNLQYSLVANALITTPRTAGLLPPTTGLMANWTIINVTNAAAWTGEAVAVQSALTATGVPSTGNVVYWPQTGGAIVGDVNTFTADPLLRTANVAKFDGVNYIGDTSAAYLAGLFDLPDMSTPYTDAANAVAPTLSPLQQARGLTEALAASSVTNEYLTDKTIVASTDWVFSMPTRRYSVAFDYAATISATDDGRRFSDIVNQQASVANGIAYAGTAFTNGYFLASNTLIGANTNFNGRQICTQNITPAPFDREETGTSSPTIVVVSPSTPADPLSFCGEATVLSINNGGIIATGTSALKASVAVKDLDVTLQDGWMRIATPAANIAAPAVNGLPMVGAAFERMFANAGLQSFGATYNHRFGR